MVRAPDAARGVDDLARVGLGGRHQVFQGLVGRIVAHHQDQRALLDQQDGRDVVEGVEVELLEQRVVHRQRGQVAHAQGVAVGLAAGNRLGHAELHTTVHQVIAVF